MFKLSVLCKDLRVQVSCVKTCRFQTYGVGDLGTEASCVRDVWVHSRVSCRDLGVHVSGLRILGFKLCFA